MNSHICGLMISHSVFEIEPLSLLLRKDEVLTSVGQEVHFCRLRVHKAVIPHTIRMLENGYFVAIAQCVEFLADPGWD